MKNAILGDLNKEQKEAVTHKKGPLLIVAGAGTGKTTVLTRRVAYLIDKGLVMPDEILALTFTEKAAEEMEKRVDRILPIGKIVENISTFHSFCEQVLREESLEIGLDPSFEVLDTAEQWLFISEHLFEFDLDYFRPVSSPFKFIRAIILAISRLKDEAITPEEFDRRLKKFQKKIPKEELKKLKELAKFYKKYEKLLKENSLTDFGGLILNTIELFNRRPNILKKYQKKFRYILVDEFQDTNFAQNELVKILAGKDKNITVAADDDQAIYRFRGASIENVLDFEKNFPRSKRIILKENFRSFQDILDPAYHLIQQNNPYRLEEKSGIPKKLNSKRGRGAPPRYFRFSDISEEALWVASRIEELVKKEKRPLEDFAILGRTNADIDFFRNVLAERGIPFVVAGSRGLFEEGAVRDLISFLKVIANPDDNLSFFRFLNFEIFGLKDIDKIKIFNLARKNNLSVYEVLKDKKLLRGLDKKTRVILDKILRIIKENIAAAFKKPTTQILANFIKSSGYFKNLEKKNREEAMRNIFEFYKNIENFERRSEEKSVFAFVNNLELMKEAGESPAKAEILDQKGAVKLMTVHSAKGLEFNIVFLVNLIKGRFPSRIRRDPIELPDFLFPEKLPSQGANIQEERRLFYVGMTRARDLLFLTSSDFVETKTKKIPSPFVFEAGLVKKNEILKKVLPRKISLETPRPVIKRKRSENPVPSHFSFSQLDDFLVCPLRYKYRYVFGIPVPKSYQLSFGNSIHSSLREFYKLFQATSKLPSFEALKDLYSKLWESDGYKSKKQEKARFKKGLEILKAHYKEAKRDFTSTPKNFGVEVKKPPLFIEKKFSFRLGGDRFIGVIDRIDPIPVTGTPVRGKQIVDKNSQRVNIIDYKTGSVRKQWEVDKLDAGPGLQMSMYAIGADRALGLDVNEFIFDYLEHQKKLSTKRDKKSFKEIEKILKNITQEIKRGDFKATPGYQQCRYCDFRDICDFAYKI